MIVREGLEEITEEINFILDEKSPIGLQPTTFDD